MAKSYENIRDQIQLEINQAALNISRLVNDQKVEMAWKIGQLVDENVTSDQKYGDKLLQRLEADVLISKSTLYKMRAFFKAYPEIPHHDKISWSHYLILTSIQKQEDRSALEAKIMDDAWDVATLRNEVNRLKLVAQDNESENNNEDTKEEANENAPENVTGNTNEETHEYNLDALNIINSRKLAPIRGQLFSYKIASFANQSSVLDQIGEKYYFDCGFSLFHEIPQSLAQKLPQNSNIVTTSKNNDIYSIKEASMHPRKLYAYKAYLDRVVDGDTLRVILDLGFGMLHKEIIRLKGINAPELKTREGKMSAKGLTNILKNVPFLIVKTIKTDLYGRYVADIFLADENLKDQDAHDVASKGKYLNRILLHRGLAQLF